MTEHQTTQVQQQQYFNPYPYGFQSIYAQPNIQQTYQANAPTSHTSPTVYVALSPPRVMSPVRLTSPPPIVMSPPPVAFSSPQVNINPPQYIYQTVSAPQNCQKATYGPGKVTGYANGHPVYANGAYAQNQQAYYQQPQTMLTYPNGSTNPIPNFNAPAPQFIYDCHQQSLSQPPITSSQSTQIHPLSSETNFNKAITVPSLYTPASSDIPIYSSEVYGSQSSVTRSTVPISISEDLRGPPQKPRQTGYALWVGNLAQDISLVELKDHFAEVEGLTSVFLLRASNCAFVNYENELCAQRAVTKFNDQVFATTRLVCRLRRSQKPQEKPMISTPEQIALKTRFFILKSLSKEDLLVSVRTKKWSTQPHNQQLLNEAFENSERVYLIFGENKSGEFFGFARMTSRITVSISNSPASSSSETIAVSPFQSTQVQITEDTGKAKKGRIIFDPSRGTEFWEVVEKESQKAGWFNVEWLCTNPLPFSMIRGIRNPWNMNREVKICRDGTEVEPSVGIKLLDEFQKRGSGYGAWM